MIWNRKSRSHERLFFSGFRMINSVPALFCSPKLETFVYYRVEYWFPLAGFFNSHNK